MVKLDGVVTGFQYQPDIGFWMRGEPVLSMDGDVLCTVTMDDDGIFVLLGEPGVDAVTFADLGRTAFNKPIFFGPRGQHRGISTNMVDRVGPSLSPLHESFSGPRIAWVLMGMLDGLEWERSAFVERPTDEQLESWLGIKDGKHVRPRSGVPVDITYELRAAGGPT